MLGQTPDCGGLDLVCAPRAEGPGLRVATRGTAELYDRSKLTQSLTDTARCLPLFGDLGAEQTARLLETAELQHCPADTVLFQEGEVPAFLHVVVQGTVELYKADGLRDYGLMLLTTGDVFMPAAAVFGEPYLNSARSLGASTILHLRADVLRAEFARSHQLAVNTGRVLAGQFRMAARHIIDLKCLSAAQRLAVFLLRIADESTTPEGARLPVAKRRLASRMGMTPETLSRALQSLAENGLVVSGTRIFVRDRARIDAFCGSPPYPQPAETGLDVHAL